MVAACRLAKSLDDMVRLLVRLRLKKQDLFASGC